MRNYDVFEFSNTSISTEKEDCSFLTSGLAKLYLSDVGAL